MLKWFFSILLVLILLILVSCFFVKKEPSVEMKSKFESGVDSGDQETTQFYLHFLFVGILFLIFDVEVVLSIPMIQSIMNEPSWMLYWLLFFSIIFLGLVVEVIIDSVDWKE